MLLQCYPRVARTYLCLHNGEEFRIPTSFVDMNMQILCTVQQCAGVAFRFVFSCSLLSILSIYRGHHQPQCQQHQGLQQRHTHIRIMSQLSAVSSSRCPTKSRSLLRILTWKRSWPMRLAKLWWRDLKTDSQIAKACRIIASFRFISLHGVTWADLWTLLYFKQGFSGVMSLHGVQCLSCAGASNLFQVELWRSSSVLPSEAYHATSQSPEFERILDAY